MAGCCDCGHVLRCYFVYTCCWCLLVLCFRFDYYVGLADIVYCERCGFVVVLFGFDCLDLLCVLWTSGFLVLWVCCVGLFGVLVGFVALFVL